MGFLGDVANVASGGVFNPGGSGPIGNLGLDMLTGGAYSNTQSQQQTNAMQMELADKQMGFQERMSSSAYQRAVEDMRKAGLNPSLAYQNGGSSTPSGAMASLSAPQKGAIGAGLFNSAKTVATDGAAFQQSMTQADLNKANANMSEVNAQKLGANAKESAQQTELLAKQTEKASHEAELRRMEKEIQQSRQGVDVKAAKVDAVVNRGLDWAGKAGTAFKQFMAPKIPDINIGGGKSSTRRYNENDMLDAAKGKGIQIP